MMRYVTFMMEPLRSWALFTITRRSVPFLFVPKSEGADNTNLPHVRTCGNHDTDKQLCRWTTEVADTDS
jgi:hypothetical protein